MRKLWWVLIVGVIVVAGFGVLDWRESQRRRELWAEATD